MNKILMFTFSLLCVAGLAAQTMAAETPQVKRLNLDAKNIAKASQVIKQNEALFKNPELMEKYMRLARSLKKDK